MSCPHLAATEATVDWVIRALHREEDKAKNNDSYLPALFRLLCSADPRLIASRADEILQAPGFFKGVVLVFLFIVKFASHNCKLWRIDVRSIDP